MSQNTIDILSIHREALNAAKTFEEYRDAHVAYVGMLIERAEADLAKEKAVHTWIAVLDKAAEQAP